MTKEGCFEKAAHAQVADLPIPTTDLKIALSPGGLSYSPVWHHPATIPSARGLRRSHAYPCPRYPASQPQSCVDAEGACVLAPTPLKMLILTVQGSSGRYVCLCLRQALQPVSNCKSWNSSVIWLQPLSAMNEEFSCPSKDPPEDTSLCVPGGRPADLSPTADVKGTLTPWTSVFRLSQPWPRSMSAQWPLLASHGSSHSLACGSIIPVSTFAFLLCLNPTSPLLL